MISEVVRQCSRMREFEDDKGVSVRRVGSGGDDRKRNRQGGAEGWKRDREAERK